MEKRGLKLNKKSQEVFGMPFTVIFSIIIIIAVLLTAFFVIGWFLDFQRCAQTGLFFNDLEKAVSEAYESSFSDTGDKPFTRQLPGSVKKVCIADLSKDWEGNTEEEKEILLESERYGNPDSNVFLYPLKEICAEARSKYISYLEEKDSLYCFDVKNGNVEIRIKRDFEGKVQLIRQDE
ncbi:hypothetical protein A3K73_03255 [Candidatus Pacearchaeota archaeon RBG_13_36_9]|nr:MAG: hypothetical protein A3K73_03255 [Candidatus Pacearchaeota archaeon RBG_13_36_9]